jgi:YesN/AraC family two-component response regulator
MVFRELSSDVGTIVDLLVKEFFEDKGFSQLVLEATLLMLFGVLLREYRNDECDKLTAKILDYISENLTTVSLSEAAEHFNYHPKYFSALIKEKTGNNFQSILIDLRLRKAAAYLEFTDISIAEIGGLIGYKDNSSLFCNFKARFGKTPADFREKTRSVEKKI